MRKSLYTRPNKPKHMAVPGYEVPETAPQTVPEVVTVSASTECHVTPNEAALKMAQYLEPMPGDYVLEPSAGTGALVQAVLDVEADVAMIRAFEYQQPLYEVLLKRFKDQTKVRLDHGCFFELAEQGPFDDLSKVIINPPFRKTSAHVECALRLLRRSKAADRTLVALVPNPFDHPEAICLEHLGPETFALAKVHTKIVRFDL